MLDAVLVIFGIAMILKGKNDSYVHRNDLHRVRTWSGGVVIQEIETTNPWATRVITESNAWGEVTGQRREKYRLW